MFSALTNLLFIAPTLYMLQVYERVVPTGSLATLAGLSAVLLFALASLALLDRLRARLLQRAGLALDEAVARAVLETSLTHPDEAEARQAMRNLDNARNALAGAPMVALFDAPWMPIYIVVCTALHPLIGVLALVAAAVLAAIALLNERTAAPAIARARAAAAHSALSHEALIGSSEAIRALGMGERLVEQARTERLHVLDGQFRCGLRGLDHSSATKFARMAFQSLALGLGALLAIDKAILPGAIFAASFLIARALSPVEQLVSHWKPLAEGWQAWNQVHRLLDARARARPKTGLPRPEGHLALQGAIVMPPGATQAALKSLSLSLSAGRITAVIGPSGSGKSTLLRVLTGALPLERGVARLDGADLADWDSDDLARHIGYVPQSPSLLAGTVAQNIARFTAPPQAPGGKSDHDAMIVAAALACGAHEMILALDNGYEHRLGSGGSGLSAGQAQKVALARALFGDPVLLLLDEPNAHLDSEGDARLGETLARLRAAGRTIVIVSHKTTIFPLVDRLVVLREGQLVASGPRDEVLAHLRRDVPPASGGETV